MTRIQHSPLLHNTRTLQKRQPVTFGSKQIEVEQCPTIGTPSMRDQLMNIGGYLHNNQIREVRVSNLKLHGHDSDSLRMQYSFFGEVTHWPEFTFKLESGDHYITRHGRLVSPGRDYSEGSRDREVVEKMVLALLKAIAQGDTEPQLPASLVSLEDISYSPSKSTLGSAWRATGIPPEHVTDESLKDLEQTLATLKVFTTAASYPAAGGPALPGVEVGLWLTLPSNKAQAFRDVAKKFQTAQIFVGDVNRDNLVSLCNQLAEQLTASKRDTIEFKTKPSVLKQVKQVITLNEEAYAPYLAAYRDRQEQQQSQVKP